MLEKPYFILVPNKTPYYCATETEAREEAKTLALENPDTLLEICKVIYTAKSSTNVFMRKIGGDA